VLMYTKGTAERGQGLRDASGCGVCLHVAFELPVLQLNAMFRSDGCQIQQVWSLFYASMCDCISRLIITLLGRKAINSLAV
jgi:hypothetical protein